MAISKKENPERWALLLFELEEASEHLRSLITELDEKGVLHEVSLGIVLGHVYAHLNRGWYSRNMEGEITDDNWEEASQFPENALCKPLG